MSNVEKSSWPENQTDPVAGVGTWGDSGQPLSTHCQVYIPQELHVPTHLKDLAQFVYWFVHKVITLEQNYKNSKKTHFPLSRQTMQQFIHPRHVDTIRSWLLKTRVIDCDNQWSKGHRSMGYRLNDRYRGPLRTEIITNHTLRRKLLLHRIQAHQKPVAVADLKVNHAALYRGAHEVRIDKEKAEAAVRDYAQREGPSKLACMMAIEDIAAGQIDFHVDAQGRIHTPFTRLWSGARHFLRINGQSLVSIDIKNSQLCFLVLLYLAYAMKKQKKKAGETPSPSPFSYETPQVVPVFGALKGDMLAPDAAEFIQQVLDGTIYDNLLRAYKQVAIAEDTQIADRSAFKVAFFREVLYGDSSKPYASETLLCGLFATLFPSIWEFIKDQKSGLTDDAFKRLALLMQRRESDFVIGTVCERLRKHHGHVPVITIHDSILTTPEHVDLVVRIFNEEFKRHQIQPALKIEPLGDNRPNQPA